MMSAKKLAGVESISIAASLVLVITIPVNSSEYIYQLAYAQNSSDSYNAAYNRGYEDGQKYRINEQIRDGESGHNEEYIRGYLDGFLDGCLSVEGNDEDICNSAMDS
jgi:hypothetical protein